MVWFSVGVVGLVWRHVVINKIELKISSPIKAEGNRWYYSDDVYISIHDGYYKLMGRHGYTRSFNNMYDAISAALFQVRFSS